MGFPEMAFNLFPGMGGYSLVARRSGMRLAEELIGTGESHTEWLQARGRRRAVRGRRLATRTFIDVLPQAQRHARMRAPAVVLPVALGTMDITEDWVEAAFSIDPKDRAYMERLVSAEPAQAAAVEAGGSRIERPAAGVQAPGDPAHALRRSGAAARQPFGELAAGMGLAYR